jgi:hypothetical protein
MPDETEKQEPAGIGNESESGVDGAAIGVATPKAESWASWTPEVPPPPEPRSLGARLLEAAAWTVGVAAVLLLGRVLWLFDSDPSFTGFERGVIVGQLMGAVLMGFVVRWAWVKLRKRGRVRSPWALLVATAILAANLSRVAGGVPAAPVATVPIDTYLMVGAPYTLGVPPASVASQFTGPLDAKGARSSAVREIHEAGELVGYLVVADIGATDDAEFVAGVVRGFEDTAGNDAQEDTIDGRTVVVGKGADSAAVIWVESPYLLALHALDIESGKILAGSVMAAYR